MVLGAPSRAGPGLQTEACCSDGGSDLQLNRCESHQMRNRPTEASRLKWFLSVVKEREGK